MGIYYLSEALKRAASRAKVSTPSMPLEAHKRAVDLMEKSVFGELSLVAIQGPPGTGKTSVVDRFAERRLDELITEKRLLIYVAPTNHLVFEAFQRMASILLRKGYNVRDILDCVRVYGSKIYPAKSNDLVELEGELYSYEDLKRLTGRLELDNVKLVFATEFQRVFARLGERMEESVWMHVVADEASKTPFFIVFLPIAEEIVRNPESYPISLTVLGDPQQAITVPEAMKAYRIPLLMRHVEKVLELSLIHI